MDSRIERRRRAPRAAVAVALLVIAGGMVAPTTLASDHVRFQVPEPFRVGSHLYAAGVIAVRQVTSYNPSISLLEVWVNGDCLGIVTARNMISEEPPRRTEALFDRDEEGRLVMVGYRVTGTPEGTTYRFP